MVTENNTKLFQIVLFLFKQYVYHRDQEMYGILIIIIEIWYGAILKNYLLKQLWGKNQTRKETVGPKMKKEKQRKLKR